MKQDSQRYQVKKFWCGKDIIYPDEGYEYFTDRGSALSAAESRWASGQFEMVNVTDNSSAFANHYPHLLWLRHRPESYGAKTLPSNKYNVQMPDFPEHMTPWLWHPLPVHTWAVNFAGEQLLGEESLAVRETATDILHRILNSEHLMAAAILNPWPLNFGGLSVIDNCAHFIFL